MGAQVPYVVTVAVLETREIIVEAVTGREAMEIAGEMPDVVGVVSVELQQ